MGFHPAQANVDLSQLSEQEREMRDAAVRDRA
jgi:hypothetical protein